MFQKGETQTERRFQKGEPQTDERFQRVDREKLTKRWTTDRKMVP